jgi:excisionase family DNA binding protein
MAARAPLPLPTSIPKPSIESATLLTIPRAAELLSVSRDSVYDLLNCGALPYVLIKGKRRVRLTDLTRYVARLT